MIRIEVHVFRDDEKLGAHGVVISQEKYVTPENLKRMLGHASDAITHRLVTTWRQPDGDS